MSERVQYRIINKGKGKLDDLTVNNLHKVAEESTLPPGTQTLSISKFPTNMTLSISGANTVSIDAATDTLAGLLLPAEKLKIGNSLEASDIGVSIQPYDPDTTLAGNDFNGPDELVQLDSDGKLPPVDGSQLTGIDGDKHLQFFASGTIWTINHNMGKRPSVDTYDSAGTEIEGVVQHIDNNTLKIYFNKGFSGSAILN